MGIFSSIKEKLFGKADEEVVETTEVINAETAQTIGADLSDTSVNEAVDAEVSEAVDAAEAETADAIASEIAPSGSGATGGKATAVTSPAVVDVAAIMDAAVEENGQDLDWRHSIVDMMKALDLDSSLQARKELATELEYPGDMGDSAEMNIWLHKALMKALADNGGKVPAELLD